MINTPTLNIFKYTTQERQAYKQAYIQESCRLARQKAVKDAQDKYK